MGRYVVDIDKYATLARQTAAEGCVLVKNENQTLPLRKGDKVAVFGRMAFHYYKSGLGSGGLVNTKYVVGILDALRKENDISLDENLLQVYEDWIKDHPYDAGVGWGRGLRAEQRAHARRRRQPVRAGRHGDPCAARYGAVPRGRQA